ncbi:MAG: regulatory protein RecX [Candidatus Bipolaricaulota bacterium]|nr:regulatory protein RecX [Candidatus Bipolaricaulota bacterium]
MRLLRYRPRSVAEVRRRLLALRFTDQETEKAVATAKAAGLLDDEVFTKVWVEDRLLHHPLSRRAIKQELADKGIDKGTVDETLEKLYPAEKEKELALSLAQTRLARYSSLDRAKQMQRTTSFLIRRGFNPALASQVVRGVIERLSEREIGELSD